LTAIMTSSEIEASDAKHGKKQKEAIRIFRAWGLYLFDTPPEMDLIPPCLRPATIGATFLEVDVGFIHELGYACIFLKCTFYGRHPQFAPTLI
jgi:hypothetical protein